jgi:hypothetical protein
MKQRALNTLQIVLAVIPFIVASTAYAQTGAADNGLCGGDALSQLFCSTNLADMLNQIFKLSITLGGVLAMLRIGYAGWLYMGSADMWSTKQHAKDVFRDAIIGLLLLLAIWLILYQINPDILKLNIMGTSLGGTGGAAGSSSVTPPPAGSLPPGTCTNYTNGVCTSMSI